MNSEVLYQELLKLEPTEEESKAIIKSKKELQVWLLIQGRKGQENAITSREIAETLNIDRRTVRDIVHKLRERGLMIASSSKGNRGYFIPKDEEEARYCIRQLNSRVREILRVARTLERSYQLEGQMKISR